MFILQPTCPPVNENLMELLIMIESFKRASADRITAVIPYFGYARQDRKDEGRVPITAKLVANLITRAGADRVLAMDLHTAQIQGFFDIPVDHLYAAPVIDEHFKAMDFVGRRIRGRQSRTRGASSGRWPTWPAWAAHLAIIDKRRSSAEKTKQANVIGGQVEGRVALIFDDMISTAGSICGAAEVMHQHGARQIYLAATHGLLVGGAIERLQKAPIDGLILTDTIPLPRREADSEAHRPQRRPAVGRGHQAHPPQRVGEPAVRIGSGLGPRRWCGRGQVRGGKFRASSKLLLVQFRQCHELALRSESAGPGVPGARPANGGADASAAVPHASGWQRPCRA